MKVTTKFTMNAPLVDKIKHILRDQAKTVPKHRVSVGLHEAEDAPKVDYHGKPTNETLVDAAAMLEFGAGNVPERSFIRSWFDRNVDRHKKEMQLAAIAERKGEMDAIPLLAEKWQAELVAAIADDEFAFTPLSPRTIAEREEAGLLGDPPLLATGQLVRAIRGLVDDK